jgi:sulfate transport system ATP-binding protein
MVQRQIKSEKPAADDPREITATSASAAASVRGLSKSFGAAKVLDDINFEVAEGESLVLLGASGSGKTTILRIIAGLEEPDAGRVILHGRDVTKLPARERGVGVIFQDYALFPRMTVEENIGFGLKIRKQTKIEIKETIERLIKLVHLEEHAKKRPSQLSGGQQQRVAIARTLAYEPQVLLFDEPFGALDTNTRTRIRREIRILLKEVRVPAIFITHDQEEALELGDRIAVLHAGRLEQIGTPYDVYNKPETEYVATFLGAANLLIGVVYENRVAVDGTYLQAEEEAAKFRNGQSIKIVFRPEDVYLRQLDNETSNYQQLATGIVEEINFVGAFERLLIRLKMSTEQPIIVTRTKAEAASFPLVVNQTVQVGLGRFRVLPNFTLASERGSRAINAE